MVCPPETPLPEIVLAAFAAIRDSSPEIFSVDASSVF